jgi:hypothetical protein
MNQVSDIGITDSRWRGLYKLGGVASVTVVLVAFAEIIVTFFPGGARTDPGSMAVSDWFVLFQDNAFMGLRNLGLLNIFMTILAIPVFLALVGAHRRVNLPYAALAMAVSFIGVAVFLATNRAFPMLDLSNQYAAATSDSQRAMLTAAGQAMLSVGQSHTPGTFLGFFLSEVAGILISLVMLRGKIFSKVSGYVGMLAFGLMLVFEINSSFVPPLFGVAMIFAAGGGLLSMAWYVLLASRLFQLARSA